MREWLRLLADAQVDSVVESTHLQRRSAWKGLLDFPQRVLNTWSLRRNESDFSQEVKEAMDGCLACKSCVGQCPIKVDVPAFRSRFLQIYHGRYLRPVKDSLVASLERCLPIAAKLPGLVNGIVTSGIGQAVLRRLGLVSLPELSGLDLQSALRERGVTMASVAALMALSDQERSRSVVIVQDAFTSYYDTAIVLDFCELLSRLGFRPWLAPFKPNGKPQHVLGFLREFERTATTNAELLNALAKTGVSLVGIDPSMTLTYRAEYVKALGKERSPDVALPQEWLLQHIDQLPMLSVDESNLWKLLPHCTEKTNAAVATADWAKVCRRLGMNVSIARTGCCGMAGLYGHEAANRKTSEAIFEMSWSKVVSDPRNVGRLVATGYSCRCQTELLAGAHLPHPVQLLLSRVKASGQLRSHDREQTFDVI
jgi:Fe-S oxidoreductase